MLQNVTTDHNLFLMAYKVYENTYYLINCIKSDFTSGFYCIPTATSYWTTFPVVSALLIVAHLEEDSPVDEDDEADVVGPVVRVGMISFCELLIRDCTARRTGYNFGTGH